MHAVKRTSHQGNQVIITVAPDSPPSASPLQSARSWYVVHSKPRLEDQACAQLERQGYEVWLPMLSTWRKVAGVWQRKQAPFFPRYLFVRPAHAGQSIAPIRSTLGVSTLVRFGTEPARLGEAVLSELQRVVAAHNVAPDERTSPFAVGEAVSISGGPLAGLQGIVTRPALERVTVLLRLLGREKEVVLAPDMLSKAA